MPEPTRALDQADVSAFLVGESDPSRRALPLWLLRPGDLELPTRQSPDARQLAWMKSVGFKAAAGRVVLLPDADGVFGGAAFGLGDDAAASLVYPAETLMGMLPSLLPPGDYRLATKPAEPGLAALSWALGAYRFRRYKASGEELLPRLVVPDGTDRARISSIAEAVAFGRDLINTPANDMGPDELEAAAFSLAGRHGASVTSIVGDDLLSRNFPLIHAVGRASPRAPRLIDITAGRTDAPKVTVVGKGITFDTGGLDIKPSSAMLLMKKDMGGAATALALAHMILAAGLDIRLRVILAVAENSVSGNAFRPGDVIRSRAGRTVEIGNTDAEGRLVLADALSLADEEAPDHLITFATLTGAARVALGPDIAPFYCDDAGFAETLTASGEAVGDLVWRLPLRTPYEAWLDSLVADMGNVAEGGFAGSIVGAIFLKRFVANARRFAHFDIYGWRPQPKPLGPRGGEVNAARAVFEALSRTYPRKT